MDCTSLRPSRKRETLPSASVRRALAGVAVALLLSACSIAPLERMGAITAEQPLENPVVALPEAHPFPPIIIPRAAPEIGPELELKDPPQVWPQIRAGMQLEHHLKNRVVREEIRWLKRNRSYFKRLGPRFEQFQAYIAGEVAARGMPAEIALLALVESALNPYAMSPDGAHGIWQFMPATAGRFGLKRDWWQDSRRDPIESTRAALDYLEILHARFGDWLLAVAAYNTGEGRVMKAVRRAKARRRGSEKDFFQLSLPRETRRYVPRLLAVSAVVKNPEDYGLELPKVRAHTPFRTVSVSGQFDLEVAAKAIGIEASELRAWNPALKQWATPPTRSYKLLVPRVMAARAQMALDEVPEHERLRFHRVRVARGDTLSAIAQRYGTSVAAVRTANNLRGDLIRVNSVLQVPAGGRVNAATLASARQTYRVRKGDSMWRIARKFGVSHKELMRVNGVGPRELLRIGQRLVLPDTDFSPGTPAGG